MSRTWHSAVALAASRNDCLGDGRIFRALRQIAHEAAVYLQGPDREGFQGFAATEIEYPLLQIILAVLVICYYINSMRLTFDPAKRAKTRLERGLDFARAGEVFEGVTLTMDDNRLDYGEPRYVTVGYLDGRVVVVVWTPRGRTRRIISMRHANEREIAKFAQDVG